MGHSGWLARALCLQRGEYKFEPPVRRLITVYGPWASISLIIAQQSSVIWLCKLLNFDRKAILKYSCIILYCIVTASVHWSRAVAIAMKGQYGTSTCVKVWLTNLNSYSFCSSLSLIVSSGGLEDRFKIAGTLAATELSNSSVSSKSSANTEKLLLLQKDCLTSKQILKRRKFHQQDCNSDKIVTYLKLSRTQTSSTLTSHQQTNQPSSN